MIKCVVCGVGEAVVPDRNNPLAGAKKICRKCHASRLLGDLQGILASWERRKLDWERR